MDLNKHNEELTPGCRDLMWLAKEIPDASQDETERFVEGVARIMEVQHPSEENEVKARNDMKDKILEHRDYG